MKRLLVNLIGIIFFVRGCQCYRPPTFISSWVLMDVDDYSTTTVDISHNLGVVPARVEVQVQSDDGFVFPGIRSGYTDNNSGSHGGVISMYDATRVRLFSATSEHNGQSDPYLVYTGEGTTWTDDNRKKSKRAYVRVRVWHPEDFPKPHTMINITGIIAGGSNPDNLFRELPHNLNAMPIFTVVQYRPTPYSGAPSYFNGWHMEAQGSSARPRDISWLSWGGLVYAVSNSAVRLWAPHHEDQVKYGVFSFCDGWGAYTTANCSFKSADVTISMWLDLQQQGDYIMRTRQHSTTENDSGHALLFPVMVDKDADLVDVMVKGVDGDNMGYRFPATGAVITNVDTMCGGVIYAYNSLALRTWHPMGVDNGLIYTNHTADFQKAQVANAGVITVQIWKAYGNTTATTTTTDTTTTVTTTPPPPTTTTTDTTTTVTTTTPPPTTTTSPLPQVDCCALSTSVSGINAQVAMETLDGGCRATYTCLNGHVLVAGALEITYNALTELWSAGPADCQIVCPPLVPFSHGDVILTSNQRRVGTSATYVCDDGYYLYPGFVQQVCTCFGNWTGAKPQCLEGSVTQHPPTATSSPAHVTTATTTANALFTTVTTFSLAATTTVAENNLMCFDGSALHTLEEIIEIAEEISKNMTVSRKTTSRYLRTLISAHDGRPSSTLIGVTGAIFCGAVLFCVLASDAISLFFQPMRSTRS